MSALAPDSKGRSVTDLRRWLRWLLSLFLPIWAVFFVYHLTKPLPEGVSIAGSRHPAAGMEFLHDLTYRAEGQEVVEQEIFDRVLSMVDAAEEFVVIDMFLFNGEHDGKREYRPISKELTDGLVSRKARDPDLRVTFITDEINNFYGAYTSTEIERLRDAGVEVITTRLSRLRDSNPVYSAGWRLLLGWAGTAGPGWLPNLFNDSGRRVTARSYLKLFNLKANHRKLIVTDQECLITSANPHDHSSFHSNIAFAGSGSICADLLEGERAVAGFSGGSVEGWPVFDVGSTQRPAPAEEGTVQLVTEGKILEAFLEDVAATTEGDRVDVAMFYVSNREVVEALLGADHRGATVTLVLDPNKDAFGQQKKGIPNRQVAWELVHRSEGRIAVRWYDTRGEQFHTKLAMVTRGDSAIILGGSANLTRRNVQDYNLEADLRFAVPREAPLAEAVSGYLQQIRNNDGGHFSLPFDAYRDDGLAKRVLYRLVEFTGFCSF